MEHIRKSGQMRADKRFRFAMEHSRAVVNKSKTLCGGEQTAQDHDKNTAAHLIKSAKIPQLAHWAVNICPDCAAKLNVSREGSK